MITTWVQQNKPYVQHMFRSQIQMAFHSEKSRNNHQYEFPTSHFASSTQNETIVDFAYKMTVNNKIELSHP